MRAPRRRQGPAAPAHIPASTATAPIRLQLLPDAPDAEGEPRCALLLPPAPGAVSRRPVLRLFASLAAAVEAKRQLEAGR